MEASNHSVPRIKVAYGTPLPSPQLSHTCISCPSAAQVSGRKVLFSIFRLAAVSNRKRTVAQARQTADAARKAPGRAPPPVFAGTGTVWPNKPHTANTRPPLQPGSPSPPNGLVSRENQSTKCIDTLTSWTLLNLSISDTFMLSGA